MTQVTIHGAKTYLSRLIKMAISEEEVIIAKGKNHQGKYNPPAGSPY